VGRIRVVYGFKIRQFFGPVRHSAATIILLGLAALVTLPVVLVAGYFLPDTPLWSSPGLGELFAAGLSAFLAFDLLFALGGGTLTHPAEIDFFATSRLRPREYLAADLLFQFTVTYALTVPAILFAGLGMGLRTGQWAAIGAAALAFLAFAAMGLALGQAVGLAVAAGRRGAKATLVVLVVLLMLPAGHTFFPSLPQYSELPYPSTAAAHLILGFLLSGPVLAPAATFALLASAVAIAWLWQSGRDVFPNLRPTMRIAFGQTDLRKVAMQQEALTRRLSVLTRRISVDLMAGDPLAMMSRFHLVRILRDGSILIVVLLTGMLVLIGAANRIAEPSQSEVTVLTSGWAGLMIPMILSYNWNATERPNLWTIAMAPRYLGTYFRGFFRATAAVTVVAGTLGAIAGAFVSPLGLVAALVMAVASCGVAVSIVSAVRIPSDAFSLKSVLPFLVVPPASIAAGVPVVALALVLGSFNPVAWALATGYAIVAMIVFDRLPARAASRFQL
jgi:hypothetical protein